MWLTNSRTGQPRTFFTPAEALLYAKPWGKAATVKYNPDNDRYQVWIDLKENNK